MSEKIQVVIRRNFTKDMNQDHLVVRTLWPQEDIYICTNGYRWMISFKLLFSLTGLCNDM